MVELGNGCGNAVGRAIVEQAMPTGRKTASREQDGQLGLLVGDCLGSKFEYGPAETPVFTFHDVQRQSGEPKSAPFCYELR